MRYRVPAAVLTAKNQKKLAAGCICREEAYESCMEKLKLLSEYDAKSRDLVGIDFELAEAVCSLFGGYREKEELSVIAAGASIHIEEADIPDGVTTGGILGDPNETPESSEDESEELRDGFSMMTLAGSPGLCADADTDTVNTLLCLIKKLKEGGRLTIEALDDLFNSFNIETALLVFDGTGTGQQPFLAVRDRKKTEIFS